MKYILLFVIAHLGLLSGQIPWPGHINIARSTFMNFTEEVKQVTPIYSWNINCVLNITLTFNVLQSSVQFSVRKAPLEIKVKRPNITTHMIIHYFSFQINGAFCARKNISTTHMALLIGKSRILIFCGSNFIAFLVCREEGFYFFETNAQWLYVASEKRMTYNVWQNIFYKKISSDIEITPWGKIWFVLFPSAYSRFLKRETVILSLGI